MCPECWVCVRARTHKHTFHDVCRCPANPRRRGFYRAQIRSDMIRILDNKQLHSPRTSLHTHTHTRNESDLIDLLRLCTKFHFPSLRVYQMPVFICSGWCVLFVFHFDSFAFDFVLMWPLFCDRDSPWLCERFSFFRSSFMRSAYAHNIFGDKCHWNYNSRPSNMAINGN